jgi:hypothetical protein
MFSGLLPHLAIKFYPSNLTTPGMYANIGFADTEHSALLCLVSLLILNRFQRWSCSPTIIYSLLDENLEAFATHAQTKTPFLCSIKFTAKHRVTEKDYKNNKLLAALWYVVVCVWFDVAGDGRIFRPVCSTHPSRQPIHGCRSLCNTNQSMHTNPLFYILLYYYSIPPPTLFPFSAFAYPFPPPVIPILFLLNSFSFATTLLPPFSILFYVVHPFEFSLPIQSPQTLNFTLHV